MRRRWHHLRIVAIAIAGAGLAVNVAFASPENDGLPNVTLDVTPNDGDNLPSTANITVIGAGFGSNISGDILECRFDQASQFDLCSAPLGRFTSDANGSFTRPVTVLSSFTALNAQNQFVTVNCLTGGGCRVRAESDSGQFFSAHHISFAGATTTTLSTTTTVAGPPQCQGRAATIIGTPGNESIVGTPGDDVIVGLAGNDLISGLGGNDTVCGGEGHDYVDGGEGNDILLGGNGNDRLIGGPGANALFGEAGFDQCHATPTSTASTCEQVVPQA